ncbi:probable serine/threonine-protein kinase clkA [Mya arenaria]|uniref:probable serine/threonine-protein kinase clkA n=1 Tax=Mya arenaria TaxID=6604 RepID=UPI0022E2DC16|nr:probable serine/threonine-protein kinase clkA [Mya arenaria]XP_052775043.1 probable serine/threonine-protein kinase clkA [Mya arenaria]
MVRPIRLETPGLLLLVAAGMSGVVGHMPPNSNPFNPPYFGRQHGFRGYGQGYSSRPRYGTYERYFIPGRQSPAGSGGRAQRRDRAGLPSASSSDYQRGYSANYERRSSGRDFEAGGSPVVSGRYGTQSNDMLKRGNAYINNYGKSRRIADSRDRIAGRQVIPVSPYVERKTHRAGGNRRSTFQHNPRDTISSRGRRNNFQDVSFLEHSTGNDVVDFGNNELRPGFQSNRNFDMDLRRNNEINNMGVIERGRRVRNDNNRLNKQLNRNAFRRSRVDNINNFGFGRDFIRENGNGRGNNYGRKSDSGFGRGNNENNRGADFKRDMGLNNWNRRDNHFGSRGNNDNGGSGLRGIDGNRRDNHFGSRGGNDNGGRGLRGIDGNRRNTDFGREFRGGNRNNINNIVGGNLRVDDGNGRNNDLGRGFRGNDVNGGNNGFVRDLYGRSSGAAHLGRQLRRGNDDERNNDFGREIRGDSRNGNDFGRDLRGSSGRNSNVQDYSNNGGSNVLREFTFNDNSGVPYNVSLIPKSSGRNSGHSIFSGSTVDLTSLSMADSSSKHLRREIKSDNNGQTTSSVKTTDTSTSTTNKPRVNNARNIGGNNKISKPGSVAYIGGGSSSTDTNRKATEIHTGKAISFTSWGERDTKGSQTASIKSNASEDRNVWLTSLLNNKRPVVPSQGIVLDNKQPEANVLIGSVVKEQSSSAPLAPSLPDQVVSTDIVHSNSLSLLSGNDERSSSGVSGSRTGKTSGSTAYRGTQLAKPQITHLPRRPDVAVKGQSSFMRGADAYRTKADIVISLLSND